MEDIFDLNQFDTYGLDHKTAGGVLYIKPQGISSSGTPYKQWTRIDGKRGITILRKATDNDVSLLHVDLPVNVVRQFRFTGAEDGEHLQRLIQPVDDDRLLLNINIDGEWKRFETARIITATTNKDVFWKMAASLINIMQSEYHDGSDILIQVVLLPKINPILHNIKDGSYNCVILPVILLLKKRKKSKSTDKRIHTLELFSQLKSEGLNNSDIEHVSRVARINIAIFDHCGSIWHKFITDPKRKTLLLDVRNRHAEVRHDPELKKEVDRIQKKSSCDVILDDPINTNIFDEQSIQWVDEEELKKAIEDNPAGYPILSKGKNVAIITPDIIYKTRFHESDRFPKAFTDGGVGKAKFLHQNPALYKNDMNPIIWDGDQSGFYMRTGKSHPNNIKFDMNHAYKSFKNSGCFKGFPAQIDKIYSYPPETKASDVDYTHHGLLYLEYPKLDIKHLMTKTDNKYPRIYYECSGWYPLEIVQSIYNEYGINPIVKAIAIGENTFDLNEEIFTNSQFRCFVGKTISQSVDDIWRTTDKNEYLRALFQLEDKITGVNFQNGCYSITYKTDKTPWQCPVISVYVKAHQKLQLFRQYNTLVDNGILPRYICVDGIEISGNQSERAKSLFDMTRWKIEQIKLSSFWEIGVIDRVAEIVGKYPLYEKTNDLPRLLHLSGSGGNGKTEFAVNLKKRYNSICYTATTHNACSELETRGKSLGIPIVANTYHSVFGINARSVPLPNVSTFVIEEASMLPDEHLKSIDERLRANFDEKTSFGGKRVILVGDFCQLPVLQPLTSLHDVWKDEKTDLYSKFTIMELSENWRQKNDPAFYDVCQKIREKLTITEAKDIINKLNDRCIMDENGDVVIPDASTIDDTYMAGINSQCDDVNNSKYTNLWEPGTKIINTKTFTIVRPYTVVKLTGNWKQKDDPEFFSLCQKIRETLDEDGANDIINMITDRCIANEDGEIIVPSNSTEDINIQCDITNSKAVIMRRIKKKVKIPSGRTGVVVYDPVNM